MEHLEKGPIFQRVNVSVMIQIYPNDDDSLWFTHLQLVMIINHNKPSFYIMIFHHLQLVSHPPAATQGEAKASKAPQGRRPMSVQRLQ